MSAAATSDRLRDDEREFRGALRRMERQEALRARVRLLGAFYLAAGGVVAAAGALAFLAIAPWGLVSGDPQAMAVLWGVGSFVSVVCFVAAAPALAAGYGLRHRRAWGRTLAVILGALLLPLFPLGTALGVATLVLLLPEEAGA